MHYVARAVDKVRSSKLESDLYTIADLEKLGPARVFPNVLRLLTEVQSYLLGEAWKSDD